MKTEYQNLKVQKWVAGISILLLVVKFVAYFATHSVAILTDALESIVNVSAGFIGLYSLYIAAKPRDEDHPYGHGKAEYISSAIEGTMIGSAGVIIIYKAIQHLIRPVALQRLDYGIILIFITAVVNFILGTICVRTARKNRSMALLASGKHLQSDTLSTVGIILGLAILYFTNLKWLDSAIAILIAVYIIFTAVKILRSSIAGIMDKADEQLLTKMVAILNANRQENWVDLHNLRVIKYGTVLHVDCHLTVPWFLNVNEAHDEVDALAELIRNNFGESFELFVHADGCKTFQCKICDKKNCPERKHPFEKSIAWTLKNISQNKKHSIA